LRYFFDTEFIEKGNPSHTNHKIDLVSFGMVSEDDREFYEVSVEWNPDEANDFVKKNVFPHLHYPDYKVLINNYEIAARLRAFVGDDKNPEFWAYYSHYDWMLLLKLMGGWNNMPHNWPKYAMDIAQFENDVRKFTAVSLPDALNPQHNALVDARWVRDAWSYLNKKMHEAYFVRDRRTQIPGMET